MTLLDASVQPQPNLHSGALKMVDRWDSALVLARIDWTRIGYLYYSFIWRTEVILSDQQGY